MAGGILDFFGTPQSHGLLAAGLGYAANARRGNPVNALGKGGLLGLGAYATAQGLQDKQAEEAQQREVRALQLDKLRADAADQKLDRETAARFLTPAVPGVGQVDSALPPDLQAGAVPMASQPAKFDLQGYANARLSQNPTAGLALLQSLQKDTPFDKVAPKDYTPESVARFAQSRNFGDLVPVSNVQIAPNGVAYDPRRTQPGAVFSDPNKPFSATGPNLAFQDFDLRKAAAGAARNSNTVINKQETEEGKTVGKFFGENYAKVQEAGMNAQGAMNRYSRLGQLLEGVDTGKFAPLGLEAAKAAQSFGLKVDPNLGNKEAAVALSSEIALQLRNPSGGAGMPGAMSDADRNFLAGMVPGIEKTPEGRREIIDTAKKLAQRDIQVAKMARDYRAKHGNINEGFYNELAQFSEANPLFQNKPAAAPAAPQATMRWDPKTNRLVPVK